MDTVEDGPAIRLCIRCVTERPLVKFQYDSRPGAARNVCHSCRNAQQRANSTARRQVLTGDVQTCNRCKIEKQLSDFPSERRGRRRVCRQCRSAYRLAHYHAHKLEKREIDRAWRHHNREVNRERLRNYRLENRDRIDDQAILRKFGITMEQYRGRLAAQGGGCAICGSTNPGQSNHARLPVDHDRSCCPGDRSCCRCVRGILCSRCNRALGLFGDDPDRLTSAARYLLQTTNALAGAMGL